ncbi:hypothetical protein [Asticcacaulis sp. BE141]|nr:hypothetical protein [Asticcacaulis sp. BE141]MBP2160084.1 hypothetical protein [Asticcacaulis solisilvae]MDR6801129.1 hypothetical protein [Asticcacaulis sp. BE141]
MKSAMIWGAKAIGLWIVLLLGSVAGGMLFLRDVTAVPDTGPLDAGQALLVVNAGVAAVLALLAARMRLRGWMLGLVLGGALFGIETFMAQVETLVFNNDIQMSPATILNVCFAGLLRAALAGVVVALMWRGRSANGQPAPKALAWKFPVIGVLYVICYFAAGQFIAWQSPDVRAFYATVGEISRPYLIAVQWVRGLMWAGIILMLVQALRGGTWSKALLSGLALSLLMDLQLLYPNPVMPWPVRFPHLIEVGVSNFVFGLLAAAILLNGGRARSA